MQQCQVCFIDCMGYWDIISEFASILLVTYVLYKTSCNWKILHHQKLSQSQIEAKKSAHRKTLVNLLSLVYQTFLLLSIIFSTAIFFMNQENLKKIGESKINVWYKWSEVIFINLLNCLNLTVGFMYWKAVRAFYKISQKSLPIIYYSFVKAVFVAFYVINFLIIGMSLFMLHATDETHYGKQEIKIMNILNAIGVSCSTIICLATRLLYQKHILANLSMKLTAIRKQKFYSVLIAFSCLCRLTCVILNLMEIDYAEAFRNFNTDCIDVYPYHAILMFLITACINIIPPFIFSIVFSSTNQHKRSYTKMNEYFCKNDESVRYV